MDADATADSLNALTMSLGKEKSSLHDLEQVAAADLDMLRPPSVPVELATSNGGAGNAAAHAMRINAHEDLEDDSIRTIDPEFNDVHNHSISGSFDVSTDAAAGFDSADTIIPGASPSLRGGRGVVRFAGVRGCEDFSVIHVAYRC